MNRSTSRGWLYRFRWLLPVASFAAGAASFVLVERGAWLAQWVTGILILSWALLLAESPLRRLLQRHKGWDMPPVLLRYGTQALHQEALFFCIPFFIASTDWASAQAVFTGLLFALALVSILDPIYFGIVGRHQWLLLAFHGFVIFTALLTALPIVMHLTTAQSLLIAAGVMAVTAVPSLAWRLPLDGARALAAALLIAPLLGVLAWSARSAIPPATLRVTHAYLTQDLDPVGRFGTPIERPLRDRELREGGIYTFTAIRAPRGLHEDVFHVWTHEGRTVDRIRLSIAGGREDGYRSWSRKQAFEPRAAGRWEVLVETAGGQRLGRLVFRVLP